MAHSTSGLMIFNKLRFTATEYTSIQDSVFLAMWSLRRRFQKIWFFFALIHPIVALPYLWADDLNKLWFAAHKDTSTQDSVFWSCGFLRRFLKIVSIYYYVKIQLPRVTLPHTLGWWIEQTWMYTTRWCLYTRFSFCCQMVLKKFFWKIPTNFQSF